MVRYVKVGWFLYQSAPTFTVNPMVTSERPESKSAKFSETLLAGKNYGKINHILLYSAIFFQIFVTQEKLGKIGFQRMYEHGLRQHEWI